MHPVLSVKAIFKLPILRRVKAKGMISPPTALLLQDVVRKSKYHTSQNVIEVGAYKGKSTCFLSLAAKEAGKRVKSFEIFTGLPPSDPEIDPLFSEGQFASDVETYQSNILNYGRPECVDLTIGDARETMQLTDFCCAFIDVDIYEVTRDLLNKLYSIAKGGEVILVHDANFSGVKKAIQEWREGKTVKITYPELITARIEIPKLF